MSNCNQIFVKGNRRAEYPHTEFGQKDFRDGDSRRFNVDAGKPMRSRRLGAGGACAAERHMARPDA